MLMIRSAAVVVLLAAVYQASGFVSTRRRQRQPSAIIRSPNNAVHTGDSDVRWGLGTLLTPADGVAENLALSQSQQSSYSSLESPSTREAVQRWARKPSKSSNPGDDDVAVQQRPGMATQLGGWSYARTVLSGMNKPKDGGGDSDGSGRESSGASGASGAASAAAGSGGGTSGDKGSSGGVPAKGGRVGGEKTGRVGLGGDG
ncbi:unnamed protein product, partial [Pylaiella littoralis]